MRKLLRPRLGGVLVVAAMIAAVATVVSALLVRARDDQIRASASAELIDPLISCHINQESMFAPRARACCRLLRAKVSHLVVDFGLVPPLVRLLPPGPMRPLAARELWGAAVACRDRAAADPMLLRRPGFTYTLMICRIAEFHRASVARYRRLKADHVVTLPPIPPELQAGLDRAEAEARRCWADPTVSFYPETFPNHRPGAARIAFQPSIFWLGDIIDNIWRDDIPGPPRAEPQPPPRE